MEPLTHLVRAFDGLVLVVGAIVVVASAVILFVRHLARGEGLIVGAKRFWGMLWRNLP
jgi:hypothetical protein